MSDVAVYPLGGEVHRNAMIGRLVHLAGRVAFDKLDMLVDAAECWAEEAAPDAPTLRIFADPQHGPVLPTRIEDTSTQDRTSVG